MNSEELQASYGFMRNDSGGKEPESIRTSLELVKEFHEVYGHPISDRPRLVADDRLNLRLTLIQEEWEEVREAAAANDLENLAKELADLVYVVNGFAVEAGIDLDRVLEEVHRSNMSKLGEDGKPIYRLDGKVMKGPNYSEADIKTVLGL